MGPQNSPPQRAPFVPNILSAAKQLLNLRFTTVSMICLPYCNVVWDNLINDKMKSKFFVKYGVVAFR